MLWTVGAVIIFLSVPVAIGLYYGVKPDWKVFGSAAIIIPLIINFLSGLLEPILYAPMLGTNSAYLAFITGNLSNLKIPCVVKAHEIYPTENGTEEHEVISTISVAASTLVTVVIIAILVLCLALSNLSSLVQKQSWIMPAFSCVVYALFGSLGGKYIAKNPKFALIPLAIVVVLSVAFGFIPMGAKTVGEQIGSAYLFIGIAVCVIVALSRIGIEKRKQKAQEEKERLQHIACGVADDFVDNEADSSEIADVDSVSDTPENADSVDNFVDSDANSNEIADVDSVGDIPENADSVDNFVDSDANSDEN